MDTAFAGALRGDFGPIARTNAARAGLVKIDWRLSDRHNLSLKYNHTWSQQENGTFDVDAWARSANGLEKDYSNAVNGSLVSYLSSRTSNELRFQYSREDRPRPYEGPRTSLLGPEDRKSTRLNSSHGYISYAVFCLKKKKYNSRPDHVNIKTCENATKFTW